MAWVLGQSCSCTLHSERAVVYPLAVAAAAAQSSHQQYLLLLLLLLLLRCQ
jgi:hypothetical protein